MGEISSLTYLTKNLSEMDKRECLNFFMQKSFLAYNYQNEEHEDASLLLTEKYIPRKRYSLRYGNEDFVISLSNKKDYISCLIDGDSEESSIILDVSDFFAKKLTSFVFSQIDEVGDKPDNLDNSVQQILLDNLFKYNYFGTKYLEKYGSDFFQKFPAEHLKFISNQVVRIDLVKNFNDSISQERKDIVISYLQKFGMKNINFYNAKLNQF